jgi:dTDP-4-dehydrorhamnose 3,5-epimerase
MKQINDFFGGAVRLYSNPIYRDDRGSFKELYHKGNFALDVDFVQDNLSISKGMVFRGIHIQTKNTQGKLIQCIKGKIFDYFVDLRIGSPSFGQWERVLLDGSGGDVLWIPQGFGHGFETIAACPEKETIVTYKCDDYYNPEGDVSLYPFQFFTLLRAKDYGMSDKDQKGITLDEYKEMVS